jgi:hypothetical protein
MNLAIEAQWLTIFTALGALYGSFRDLDIVIFAFGSVANRSNCNLSQQDELSQFFSSNRNWISRMPIESKRR